MLKTLIMVATFAIISQANPITADALEYSQQAEEDQQVLNEFFEGYLRLLDEDGYWGPDSGRVACAARRLMGWTVGTERLSQWERNELTDKSLSDRRPLHRWTLVNYLSIDTTCHMTYSSVGGEWDRVLRTSSGAPAELSTDGEDYRTPKGLFRLGWTRAGWVESSKYEGGWMLNPRNFISGTGYHIHGSWHVPARSASHGCIRVEVSEADYVLSLASGTYVHVYGENAK
ncbi:MAG: L,D-transpeptidase [Candidatus Saccharimonadales bacterium]|nr:L,D-transpeptidase [Candidatus Saccharimonadales bacterium]